MDKATYEAFRRKAIRYAFFKGYGYLAEDFAQEYIIHVVETRSQFIETFFIDFLRKEFPGSRNPINRKKLFLNFDDLEIYDECKKLSIDVCVRYRDLCETYNAAYTETRYSHDFSPFAAHFLKEFERGYSRQEIIKKYGVKAGLINQIYVVYMISRDYTQREIAKRMGLTEPRVSQLLTEFKKSEKEN